MLPLAKLPKDIQKYIPVPFRIDKAYVMVEGACEHLVDGNFCSIYEKRPEVCRAYDCKGCHIPTKVGHVEIAN